MTPFLFFTSREIGNVAIPISDISSLGEGNLSSETLVISHTGKVLTAKMDCLSLTNKINRLLKGEVS